MAQENTKAVIEGLSIIIWYGHMAVQNFSGYQMASIQMGAMVLKCLQVVRNFVFLFRLLWGGCTLFSSNPMSFYGLLFSMVPGRCIRKIHDVQVMSHDQFVLAHSA